MNNLADIVDTNEVITTLLLSLPHVTNLVGTRVYGPPGLPTDFTIDHAVMFLNDGGPGNIYLPVKVESVPIYCYGKTARLARKLFRALDRDLHGKGHGWIDLHEYRALFQYAEMGAGPIDRVEPDTEFCFCYSSWSIQIASFQYAL